MGTLQEPKSTFDVEARTETEIPRRITAIKKYAPTSMASSSGVIVDAAAIWEEL
jgi:hypothetical protein